MVAEHSEPMTEAVLLHQEGHPQERRIDSAQVFELGVHALDLLRVRALALVQRRPEELRALEDHFRVVVHEEAVARPGCYAADRPGWPGRPDSGAALHGTTCTRALCPCSESPGWSGSGRRSRPGFSGCASDWAAVPGHGSLAHRDHPGCPDSVAVEIVAAGSKRPTCLFFVWSLCSRFCPPLQTRSIFDRRFTVVFRILADYRQNYAAAAQLNAQSPFKR